MTEPQAKRRRRRPAVSCTLCRSRKVKCNRELPCNNCLRGNRENCVYEDYAPLRTSTQPRAPEGLPSRTKQQYFESPLASAILPLNNWIGQKDVSNINIGLDRTTGSPYTTLPASLNIPTSVDQPSAADIHIAADQIGTTCPPNIPAQPAVVIGEYNTAHTTSAVPELCNKNDQDDLFGRPQVRGRVVIHKSRLFGQSHWMNGCDSFRDVFGLIESYLRTHPSSVLSKVETCKSLARTIKANRAPAWPTTPTTDLPPKELADKLLDCYLSTYETVYRILHVPTFKTAYETLWMPGAKPDMGFLVQVKLVLALGVGAYDDNFSLRDSAVKWIYEGQTWLSAPTSKSRLTIQSLQTKTLLLLAREKASIGGDLVWISAGSLLRSAVYMGLHRDPVDLPKRSLFAAEMRRRVWNTILEVILQASMTSGGPPMISLDDFNTQPPGNFDDEQLLEKDPTPKPEDKFTQVSIARTLRQTFPQRLAVAKYLNDLSSHSQYKSSEYEEMLRLDEELRASYKGLCRTLQQTDRRPGDPTSQFAFGLVDIIMLRYVSALHIVFHEVSLHDKTYAYSRTTLIDTLLKIWYSLCRPPSSALGQVHNGETSSGPDYLHRLLVLGSGISRAIVFQAAVIIAAEVRAQLREHESLGTPRPDLLAIVYEEKRSCLQNIEAGETNIKGWLFMSLICAQLEAIMRGVKEDEYPELLIRAGEEAMDLCLPILQEKVAQTCSLDGIDSLDPSSLATPLDFGDEWDFMTSDGQFNWGDLGSMDDMFDGMGTQQPW